KWLKDPNTRLSTFDFSKALLSGDLLEEHRDFVIIDCYSEPDFDYRQMETLRNQQSLRFVPFLFILSDSQDTLKKQLYLVSNNYLLIEPLDTFAFVSLVTSALHTSKLERRLLMYKDFVEGEKKLIANMDDLLELSRIYQFENERQLVEYIRTNLLKRIEMALALETAIFAEYSEDDRTLTIDQYDEKQKKVLKHHTFQIEGAVEARLLSHGYPHILEGKDLNDPLLQEMEESLGLKVHSVLFIPVNVFHRPLGVLLLLNKLYRNEFSENDLAFGLLVSQKLSYRLENLRMNAIRSSEQNELEGLFSKYNQILKEWKLFKQILDSINSGVILFDEYTRIHYLNEAARQQLRFPAHKKQVRNLSEVFSENSLHQILNKVKNEQLPLTRQELYIEKENNPDYYLGYSIYPIDEPDEPEKYIIVFSEISHSKRLQAEVIRMDRMASMGVLSSGIAHE
ncbi:MAG TPA: PAS domain-containing protein, partial [Calditrichaeota bacterium]|nr:PAS domain-containing protein [Calditrichota bacterium]